VVSLKLFNFKKLGFKIVPKNKIKFGHKINKN
jgi:hypothetical protein